MKTRVFTLIMMAALFLSGCALNGYETIKPVDYPVTRKIFDLTFGWKNRVTDTGVVIDGYARNNRYYIIENLELRITLLDSSGKERAFETFFFIPSRLPMDDSARFSVVLGVRPQPGDKLRFHYSYQAVEDNEGGLFWMDSFEVPALE